MELAYRSALVFSRPRIWVVFGMIAERLRQGEQQATVSDARLVHLSEFKARFQPADEIPSAEKTVIDTGTSLLANIILVLSDES